MPFHKGHKYCIDVASSECEKVYVIIFYGGDDELRILKENHEKYLSLEDRIKHLKKLLKNYDNTELVLVDVSKCKYPDGTEDWDAETPLVRQVVGDKLDAAYSSEISYDPYYKKAFPECEHRIVDYKRIHYPISGTKIRNMKSIKERNLWII